ncbi:ABC transporter permease [Dyadobacter subterraneus]|uniref:ABC transporter permease n=1 Tax=Dyadobacter subterraneus TaxID=2773304 RepID=A0ABR9W848_9BACT|nr:ABC transporter permease [Dyadobacter subterraneus]MBE9461651.1 ABC transporter permease [Dyadobacter subterraneus]
MIRNYLKIALRNLWKDRLFSMISIVGLAAGLAVSIIIIQFVVHEWSYDKFHDNGPNIYRVIGRNKQFSFPFTSSKLAGQLAAENPEIKAYTRVIRNTSAIIKNSENPGLPNEEKGFIFADPSLFSVFTFPLKYGNAHNVLERPYTVVISERMADKYFGKENPVGKHISYNVRELFEITGVVKNVPTNSTLNFDFVSSQETFSKVNPTIFESLPNFETFLLIDRKESVPKIARNIKVANKLIAALNYNENDSYELEPFYGLRLGDTQTFNEKPGPKLLYILSGISVLILSLALFNYINLATARATLRAKEVGVRKAIGAKRSSLAKQFFLESTLVTFLAFLLSIVFVLIFRESFNNLFGFTIDLSFLVSKIFMVVLAGLFVVCTILAGMYPALILSGFSPVKVLKGNYLSANQGTKARSAMLVFQFSVSAILILCSLVIQQQIRLLKNQDLGFNKEQMLRIYLGQRITERSDSFKKAVVSRIGSENVSLSKSALFGGYALGNFQTASSGKTADMAMFEVDADFVKNSGAKWIIEPEKSAIKNREGFYVTLNEEAVKKLGFTNTSVIGQTIMREKVHEFGTVVGVIRNFYLTTTVIDVQPMLFCVQNQSVAANGFSIMYVRFHPSDDVSEKIALLEKIYHAYDPGTPFRYSFLDDDFQHMFISQTRISYLIRIFTVVAISLSCLGLLGLITFISQTRSKEISIRKVMGASIVNIFTLLSRDFILLVLVSVLISTPVSYYFMHQWLQNFAHRIEISWCLFAAGGIISLIVALLSISYVGLKTAMANPIDSLRSE